MKKILQTLLMLTCVLGLTACGSEDTMSEHQLSKIKDAEVRSTFMIECVEDLVNTGEGDIWLEDYNNIELADKFSTKLAEKLYAGLGQYFILEVEGKGIRNAITSFESSLEKAGSIVEAGEASSIVDDDTIIVTVPVTCENGTGSIELIFTNDIYCKMTSCTLNLNESFGDLMERAALNTLIGMGTVFIVLILISIIIACFGIIPKIQAKLAKKDEKPVVTPVQTTVTEKEELVDDTELVAVIAAAIAAYEGTSTEGFRVRSIKRANTKKWQRA